MRWENGLAVLTWSARLGRRTGGQNTPRWGEKRWVVERGHIQFLCHWLGREGVRVTAVRRTGHPFPIHEWNWYEDGAVMPLKRRASEPDTLQLPLLNGESKLLAKCSLLREFLSARAYDDNSPRTPGYLWLKPGVSDYGLTLFDPDSAQKVTVRARNLDDLFAAVELLLGAADGPWEPDSYLAQQAAKKPKRKK